MKSFKNALIFLLDLIYPTRCVICKKYNKEMICNYCMKKLNINVKLNTYLDKYFDEHLYIFKYDDIIRKLLIDYKFNDKAYLYKIFKKIILKNEKICRKIKKYDIIIPVPIHKNRKNQRGYNQSELIAMSIADCFENIELVNNSIIKLRNTKAQSTLSKEERIQNVKDVYKLINNQKILNKKVILFDDIYTTGSTANECSKLLKQAGAKEILVLTIAKDIIN